MGAFTGETRPEGLSVAAVIVTFNRREIVLECLAKLLGVKIAPDHTIVVDNASSDGTSSAIHAAFPQVIVLEAEENLGPAGGFHRGMAEAFRLACDWIMVLNDDCFVEPDTLQGLLNVAASAEGDVGIIAPVSSGNGNLGNVWRHRLVPIASGSGGRAAPLVDVDQVTFSGALVRADLTERVGLPRSDYFMMWEEVEYCLRVREHGFRVLVVPGLRVRHDALGRATTGGSPWREYYQIRNHLRFVLERRSLVEGLYWLVRHVRFTVSTLAFQDRKAARIWLRLLGVVDAIRGRMGRTITPRKVEVRR